MLFSEMLDLQWRQSHKSDEDYSMEKDSMDYEQMVAHFERDEDCYIRSDDRHYSNPISL